MQPTNNTLSPPSFQENSLAKHPRPLLPFFLPTLCFLHLMSSLPLLSLPASFVWRDYFFPTPPLPACLVSQRRRKRVLLKYPPLNLESAVERTGVHLGFIPAGSPTGLLPLLPSDLHSCGLTFPLPPSSSRLSERTKEVARPSLSLGCSVSICNRCCFLTTSPSF